MGFPNLRAVRWKEIEEFARNGGQTKTLAPSPSRLGFTRSRNGAGANACGFVESGGPGPAVLRRRRFFNNYGIWK